MSESNYWTKLGQGRISRRGALRGAAVGVAGLAGAALIGCGDDDDAGGAATPTDATLTSAVASDIGSGDPQSLGGTGGGNWPNTSTHFGGEGLVTTEQETRELIPNIAKSWEEAPDHLSFVFKLRDDVYFHNDAQMTAEDVKFSMDRGALGQAEYNPEFQGGHSRQFQGRVRNVEVLDDLTVKFNLEKPDVIFINRLGSLQLVPKAYIEEVGDVGFAEQPIGAGFFKFLSRIPDSEIKSERWDRFFGGAKGNTAGFHTPYIKNLIQKVIPDNQARFAALQAGEVDLIDKISPDIANQLSGDDNFKVHFLPGTQPMHIHINTAQETDPETGEPNPWRDKRVRKAANLAVDLDSIIKNILTGAERPSFGSNTASFGFPQGIFEQRWGHDVGEAKKLMAAAGYEDGFSAVLNLPVGRWPNSRQVSEIVAQSLTDIGITTRIQELQYQEVTTRFKDDSLYPLSFWGMAGGDDPGANFSYGYHSTGNYTMSVPDPQVDEWIEASALEFDTAKRAELIGQIITKFYLDAQWIFLYEPIQIVATTNKWDWTFWGKTLGNPEYWNIRPTA
jgi:peptide/nickel transport system substrate-binding protein